MRKFLTLTLFSFWCLSLIAQTYQFYGNISADKPLLSSDVEIFFQQRNQFVTPDKNLSFQLDSLQPGEYFITLFSEGYETIKQPFSIVDKDVSIQFNLKKIVKLIDEVEVQNQKDNAFGITRLRPVEGTSIYAGKKSEVVKVGELAVNLSTNNARQIFSKVAGINIWENDGAGIQLGIGGRGLSPNRVSNFNTRQNGYDISADALGYPESYYSPPSEAVERIEIVRGAASLQYGTQFGGFLNFKLKDGPEKKPIEVLARQTVGSFGLYNSFTSVGGNYKKLKHYTYFQYKRGEGWRPNSDFEVFGAHTNLSYQFNSKIKLGFEYTFMNYLAQQAGGLTDFQFEQDPKQSNRERNWFKVNWNLAALNFDFKVSSKTNVNIRAFGLLAGREAVGILDQITRADFEGTERNLLSDNYKNYGIEGRYLTRYELLQNNSIFLVGMRYYNGFTQRNQGNGSTRSNANFSFVNENLPEDSRYEFPSQNLAFFTENVFYLTSKFTVTPGIRFEHISTNADGYYFERFIAINGDTLQNNQLFEKRNNDRNFLLGGIGLSYKASESFESYANFSQNYRSINFNDMRIDNPNYVVDPNLKDERGFSLDAGIRGNRGNWFNYDVSLFLLQYDDRIGTTLKTDSVFFRPFRFRTNISDSRSFGLESFAEVNLLNLLKKESKTHKLSVFSNFSWMQATYINSLESAFEGKLVELVPQIIFRGGVTYRYKSAQISYQQSYTAKHFSDATNATFSANAVFGEIPAYSIADLSLKYLYKNTWTVETGINNLLDARYFTRRASGYPGPGIIPSDARSFYFTLGFKV